MSLLSAQNLSFGFGANNTRPILEDISLRVEPGESVALIGPNGVGKTTLLRLLAGMLTPATGQVLLQNDEPIQGMSRRKIARQLTLVPQARPQVFDFSALELVLMGFHAQTARFALPSTAQKSQALAAMKTLDVADLATRPASALSGGEFQRVLMARTMVSGAGLWLLDEPTANLDLRHQVALLTQVRAHCDAGGAAIGVLHDLALVHRYFTRVLVLHGTRLLADGPTHTTLSDALLSQVFQVDLRGGTVAGQRVWVVEKTTRTPPASPTNT